MRMIFFTAAIVCACTTAPVQPDPVNPPSAISTLPSSGLGPQTLEPGACGLFLWSKTDIDTFIFFSEAGTGQAQYSSDVGPIALTQTGAGGGVFGQFTTRMTYQSDEGNTFNLTIVPGADLENGQRLESGLLTLTDQEGWQTKLPVLGVRACQPD